METISAEELEDEVLAAFRRHTVLRQRALEITADDDGMVELTGWVRRERDVRMARRVAARVPWVQRVVVDVAVREASRDTAPDTGREAGRDAVRTAADARKA